jgi:chromosomal replication initiation ATPase DnaA
VEEGLLREIQSPLETVQWQTALGRENFLQRLKDHIGKQAQADREVPALRQLRRRPETQSILACVAQAYGCSKQALTKPGTRGNEARAVAMVLVWDCCAMSLREIGELFGGAGYTAVAQMIQRTREKNRRGALKFNLAKLLSQCVK